MEEDPAPGSLLLSQVTSLISCVAPAASSCVLSIADRRRGVPWRMGSRPAGPGGQAQLAWGGPTWLLTLHGALLAGQTARGGVAAGHPIVAEVGVKRQQWVWGGRIPAGE